MNGLGRSLLKGCCGIGVLLAPALTHAEAAPAESAAFAAELSYTRGPGAESCPDEAALRRAVVARLGADPFSGTPAQRFHIEVSIAGDRLVGRIALVNAAGDSSGQRKFEGSHDCTELIAALALAVSLAINPNLGVKEQADLHADETESARPDPAAPPAAKPDPLPAAAAPPPVTPDSTSDELHVRGM